MSIELWMAFVIAAIIILIIPGPTIILVISQSIAHGRSAVMPLAGGVVLGDFTAMTLSLCGLGAVMAASAALFTILKWIGAAYLVYLGITLWRSKPDNSSADLSMQQVSNRSHFKRAFIVTALNPKSIAFFVAFLPQFVAPQGNAVQQFVILGATFLVLAGINAVIYGLFAGQLRDALLKSKVRQIFNRCGGGALVGAGIFTATLQRSS